MLQVTEVTEPRVSAEPPAAGTVQHELSLQQRSVFIVIVFPDQTNSLHNQPSTYAKHHHHWARTAWSVSTCCN